MILKNGTELGLGKIPIKIDRICDVMSWTSGKNGFINVPQLSKYYLHEIPRPGVSLVKAWEINLVFNLVLVWKFRQIERTGF